MVCATLSNATYTDMYIQLGYDTCTWSRNTIYDAFQVLGASDPSSGTVSVHEAIRGFGTLLKNGWKPLRTILIASWDGEEVRVFLLYRPLPNCAPSMAWWVVLNGARTLRIGSENTLSLISTSVCFRTSVTR